MDRRIEPRRRGPLLYTAAAGAVIVAGYFLYASIDTSTSFTLDGQRIRIAEVTEGRYEDYIPLRASVEPERTTYGLGFRTNYFGRRRGVTLAVKNMKGCLWRRSKVDLHMLPATGHLAKAFYLKNMPT